MAYARLFLLMVVMHHWSLYQLDIKEYISSWKIERSLFGATTWFCCSRGVPWVYLLSSQSHVWSQTISSNMIWEI